MREDISECYNIKYGVFYSAKEDKSDKLFFPVYLVTMWSGTKESKYVYQKKTSFAILKTHKEMKKYEETYNSTKDVVLGNK